MIASFSMLVLPYGELTQVDLPPVPGIEDWHRERIERGALAGALRKPVELWVRHSEAMRIGSSTDGTLILRDAQNGLYADVTLPNNFAGKQCRSGIHFDVLRGASIGFTDSDDRITRGPAGIVRTVTRIGELQEISVVRQPAYETYIFDFQGARV